MDSVVLLALPLLMLCFTGQAVDANIASPDWIRYGNKTYKIFFDKEVTHPEAESRCRWHDSRLAIVRSENVHRFLSGLLVEALKDHNIVEQYPYFWIGLKWPKGSTNWYWSDGTRALNLRYIRSKLLIWTEGDCAQLIHFPQRNSTMWDGQACNNRSFVEGYICEKSVL